MHVKRTPMYVNAGDVAKLLRGLPKTQAEKVKKGLARLEERERLRRERDEYDFLDAVDAGGKPPDKLKFRLQVTKSDIQKGTPSSGDACALALSLKRTLSNGDKPYDIGVDEEQITFIIAGANYAVNDMPEEAAKFIKNFDKEEDEEGKKIPKMKRVKPQAFSFVAERQDEV